MIKIRLTYNSIMIRVFRALHRGTFKFFGQNVYVNRGCEFHNSKNITIRDGVIIQRDCIVHSLSDSNKTGAGNITIGKNSNIGPRNHIFSVEQVNIGSNVLTAPNVYISDNSHQYEDISKPIINQGIRPAGAVSIGDNSWIGYGCIILGAKIGKGCVIGANSFVTEDIPDYCVAVGNPARVIKKYDSQAKVWCRIA